MVKREFRRGWGTDTHPREGSWNFVSQTKIRRLHGSRWESLVTDGKEGGGFYSGETILGSMVVSVIAGLLERTSRWQKDMDKIRLRVQDTQIHHTRSKGVGGQHKGRGPGEWDSGFSQSSTRPRRLCRRPN